MDRPPRQGDTPCDRADALLHLGLAQAASGRLDEALASYARASALRPNAPEPLKASGEVLLRMNRWPQALESFDRACAIAPDDAWLAHNRGVALAGLGQAEEALASYERALALEPGYALAHYNRGATLMTLGRPEDALASYDRALALQPGHPLSLNNRGLTLQTLGRGAEALSSLDAALAVQPHFAEAHNNRGRVLKDLSRWHEALASFEAAVVSNPDFAEAHDNRGLLLSQLGRLDEAVQALETAIDLAPSTPRFYYHLAITRSFRPGELRLAAMQDLSRREELAPEARAELHFALAKALADTGDHAGSFQNLATGNALKRQATAYDEAAALDALGRVRSAFTPQLMSSNPGEGDPSTAPIFIVGIPRSGSTLVEQILASHPKVFAAGERDDFGDAVAAQFALAGGAAFPEGVATISGPGLRGLGAHYLKRLRFLAPAAERIVDKTLDNFRYVGLIRLALPNARIIHIRRDPVATCLSCFSLLFGGELAYAYDLGELGRYYRAYERLMAHWRTVLPAEAMLEVQYEALVGDLEGQAKRLLAYCGLEWDPGCLNFHRTERPVRTMSAAQVRRPLYSSSIGAWRAYEPFLGPLIEALGPGARDGATGASYQEAQQPELAQAGHGQMAVGQGLERRASAGEARARVALAQRLNEQGRHTEAIDWLAKAARSGDVEALTLLGLRLLTGKDAPHLPLDGARLLGDAAAAGGAEAAGHLAVLIGGGFYARQSWPAALDCLQRSSELGSGAAQAQLRILAGAAESPPDSKDWARLRQAIDLGFWTGAPAAQALSESPCVLAVKGLIPPAACGWVIVQSKTRLARAETYDPQTGAPVFGTDTRLNRIANFGLPDTSLLNLLIQARMSAAAGAPTTMMEPFAVLRYAPGEEYGEHVDYLDPGIPGNAAELERMGQRIATCLIYLNEDFEGGHTEFPQLGLSYKGGAGDALIFFSAEATTGRHDPRTAHAGRPPISGEKWLLSQFFRNRPVVGAAPRQK